ncbi:MAG: hypothetical protein M3547_03050 [Acidobacteriota bacterium]|nr:hypothetical protein [Acidobacteriota bacterium]
MSVSGGRLTPVSALQDGLPRASGAEGESHPAVANHAFRPAAGVPLKRPSAVLDVNAMRLVNPALAVAIANIQLPVTGVTRDKITVPVCSAAEASDEVLFEDPAEPGRKLYLPRYRLAVGIVDGQERYLASLAPSGSLWSLSLRLEKYAPPTVSTESAEELPHKIQVLLNYRILGATGIQKSLEFQEVTEQGGGIRAVLSVSSLKEQTDLLLALTDPDLAASLVVRRLLNVAIPAPPTDQRDHRGRAAAFRPAFRPGIAHAVLATPVRPVHVVHPGIDLVHAVVLPAPPTTPPPLYREVSRTLDNRADPDPLFFHPDLHPYIFAAVPAISSAQGPGLRNWPVRWKGKSRSYFQEQARSWFFYYLPDAFKFARRPQSPHTPLMSVRIDSPDGSTEATRVTLNYCAVPFVEPGRLEAASEELRSEISDPLPPGVEGPVFELVNSESIQFRLSLPRGNPAEGPFQVRKDTLVNIQSGLVDSLDQTLDQFQSIFDAMADTTGAAQLLTGVVEVEVGGGTRETIPFQGRMNDLVGEIFDYSESQDPVTGGVKASLLNAIESPVRIKTLDVSLERGGARVPGRIEEISAIRGTEVMDKFPLELAPGEELRLLIVPSTPIGGEGALDALFDLDGVEVVPDREAIWNAIVGDLAPEYSKSLKVKTLKRVFEPPAGGVDSQVVEVDVKFEGGNTVELSAEKLESVATVKFPISDIVVEKVDSGEYRYRVTAVRNNGAKTGEWQTDVTEVLHITTDKIPT